MAGSKPEHGCWKRTFWAKSSGSWSKLLKRVAHPTTISNKPKILKTAGNIGFTSTAYSLNEPHISKNSYWETFSPVYQIYLKLIHAPSHMYPIAIV